MLKLVHDATADAVGENEPQTMVSTFPSERTAQLRLAQLRRLRVVDRFRPLVATGSAPGHWILDSLGAAVLAAEDGVEVSELPWRRDRSISLAHSGQLRHVLTVNGFFCSLLAEGRVRADSDLVIWWSARRCAAAWGDIVRPDGYGVWAEAGRQIAFLLEYRDGRDQAGQLAERLEAYARLFDATGQRVPVLFAFPGPSQEAQARKVLSHPGVPVATAALGPGQSPADAVWLWIRGRDGKERSRLITLGHLAGSGPRWPDRDLECPKPQPGGSVEVGGEHPRHWRGATLRFGRC